MNKKNSNFIIFWIIGTILFATSALILMVEVSGYKFNRQTKTFTQTGLIIIKSNPKNAQIYLNNKLLSSTTPLRIDKLLPSQYLIDVKYAGYKDWRRIVTVDPGMAVELDKLVLIYQDLKLMDSDLNERELLDGLGPDEELQTSGGEIYLNTNSIPALVTRLSQNVKSVRIYPDKQHFAYQVGNQIKFAEIDGRGVIDIISLDSDEPVTMQFAGGGRVLLIKQKDKYFKIILKD